MIRFGFFFAAAWVGGSILMLIVAISRWLFDDLPPSWSQRNRHQILLSRIFIAVFWPLILISDGGRREMVKLLTKGY